MQLPLVENDGEVGFGGQGCCSTLDGGSTVDSSGASGSGAPSRMTIVQLDDDYEQETPSPDQESAAAAAAVDAVDAPATPELHSAAYGAVDVPSDDVRVATATAAGLALHESSPGGGGDDDGGDDVDGLVGLMGLGGGRQRPRGAAEQADDLRVVADIGDGEPLPSLGSISSDATRDLASTHELMALMSAMNL